MKQSLAIAIIVIMFVAKAIGAGSAPESSSDTEVRMMTENKELLVYTGRKAKYANELFELFESQTGIKIISKEGKTVELANIILREGEHSPADLFFAQDSSNLGALSAAGKLDVLPEDILTKVDVRYHSPRGDWIGTSGRARVFVYNTNLVKADDLPGSISDLAHPRWKDNLGWAPTNASFQAHVTAMIKVDGLEKTAQWLKAMKANGIKDYPKNTPIVKAVAEGKIAGGLVNHYYLYRVRVDMKEADQVENHFFDDGDSGLFVNISGIAILKSSQKKDLARDFVRFLLSEEAQTFYKEKNFEYPLAAGVDAYSELKPLDKINPIDIDLGDLDQVEETEKLLEETGALE